MTFVCRAGRVAQHRQSRKMLDVFSALRGEDQLDVPHEKGICRSTDADGTPWLPDQLRIGQAEMEGIPIEKGTPGGSAVDEKRQGPRDTEISTTLTYGAS